MLFVAPLLHLIVNYYVHHFSPSILRLCPAGAPEPRRRSSSPPGNTGALAQLCGPDELVLAPPNSHPGILDVVPLLAFRIFCPRRHLRRACYHTNSQYDAWGSRGHIELVSGHPMWVSTPTIRVWASYGLLVCRTTARCLLSAW